MTEQTGKKVVVLATGGTIAGRAGDAGDNLAYTAGVVGIADLLAGVPADARGGAHTVVGEQVAQVDSKDMDAALWRLLAVRCQHHLAQDDVQAVVITHGTDTMEETAYFLHALLGAGAAAGKPVVLTGAMRPASSLAPDGPQNLRDAFTVASAPGARGVVVVMAGKILAGLDVHKVHSYRPDAFEATDAGALGYVEEGRLRMVRAWPAAEADGPAVAVASLPAGVWPRVEILTSHAGAGGAIVDALVASSASSPDPLRGLVVACTGNGTIHHALEAALWRASAQGVAVLRATRCSRGRVIPTGAQALPDAGGLSPVKARIRLMLSLMEVPGA